jgi:hypothetical protein
LAFEVTNHPFENSLVENRFLFSSTEEKGGATEIVNLAGDALGVIVNESQKAVGEERVLTAGDAEMVLDVSGSLLEVEGAEVVTNGDALAKSFKGSKAELVSQVRLTKKDEGEQRGRIHLVVKQEAELIEERRR